MPQIIAPMADLPPDQTSSLEDAPQEDLNELLESSDAPVDGLDDFIEQPDGSVIVKGQSEDEPRDSEFDENLAEWLDQELLSRLGTELCELVAADKDARRERDKQYAEGIRKTGLSQAKNVGADFDGASSVVHPMLAKGCVDFASKAIKELFPSSGPVRTQILGDQSEVKLERAERKKSYMNWQLTSQIPEHRPEFEKMLSQLPLGGSQYKRWWWDTKLERPRTQAVYIDDIFLPFDQNAFYTTPRLTHREFIGKTEFDARVASGLYIDIGGSDLGEQPDRSEAASEARKVEGVSDDSAAYDQTGGTRQVYTIYVDCAIDEDTYASGEVAPYIVHVEEYGSKVLGVYRNWAESDEKRAKLDWIVEYNFIPWRGAYAIGLAQLIGSMSTASTGALNALLDSAHINNFPGGLRLKGGRNSGQTINVGATELREIDAPPGVDDIRKVVMAFPFNGPSAVLYNLVEFLTQQAEMVISTASEKIADAGSNMPMGTALALIEGGSTNFSAIHARLHHSARRELEILHRLNRTYLSDKETVEELGELIVYREDFAGPMDIIPVSDPNIFSEAQRYAQLQAVMQLEAMPEFKPYFKPEQLLVRALRLLQIPYADDIANLPKDPSRLDPVAENSEAASKNGAPLKVYEDQDDLDHLESHVIFMTSPLLGANQVVGQLALPILIDHCREHLVAYYCKNHKASLQAMEMVVRMQGRNIETAKLHAMSHAFADKAMAAQLSKVVAPGLQQAQQLMMQFQPKPPADGNMQAQLATNSQLESMKLEAAAKEKVAERQFKLQLRQLELAAEKDRADKDREANRQASALATAIEKMQLQNEQIIAKATLDAQEKHERQAAMVKLELETMRGETSQTLVVLKQLMEERTAALGDAAGSAGQQPDLFSAEALFSKVSASLDKMINASATQAEVTNSMLQQLAQGLAGLAEIHSQPKTVSYVRDSAGNIVGAQSSVGGQLQSHNIVQ